MTREFTLLRGLEGPMCSEKNYKAFFVTNLGIVADRPHIKMLAGQPSGAWMCSTSFHVVCREKTILKEAPQLEIAGGKLPLRTEVEARD